jgi:alkylation response protein AidB-like acyl-CoA dehydrogenase
MLLTQDQQMIRDAVRAFAQEQLWPNAAKWDKEHHFPKEAHQGLAALGAYGICVPEEFGGANLDYVTLALVLEEIAAGDGGTSTAISVTNCPVNAILLRYGNAQQKKQWLTRLAQGELLGVFCLTEPHVGSDASALRTTAVKEGDSYVINGVKQFITSGKNGHLAIVIAVTDKAAGKKGMSAFLVPTDTPGYGWPGWRTSSASTAVTRRRSTLTTAASRGEPDRRRRRGLPDCAERAGRRAHRHCRAERGHGPQRAGRGDCLCQGAPELWHGHHQPPGRGLSPG